MRFYHSLTVREQFRLISGARLNLGYMQSDTSWRIATLSPQQLWIDSSRSLVTAIDPGCVKTRGMR